MLSPSLSPSLGLPGPNPGTIAGIEADNNFCPCGFIVVKSGATAVATGPSAQPQCVLRSSRQRQKKYTAPAALIRPLISALRAAALSTST